MIAKVGKAAMPRRRAYGSDIGHIEAPYLKAEPGSIVSTDVDIDPAGYTSID